jgi:DNA-directed RNA polymerase subunit RPC12/RpoP
MRHIFNNILTDALSLTTFRCSGCGKQFKLVIAGQTEMECPHCSYKYVLVLGEWQSKKWVDFLVKKQRERLDKSSPSH